MGIISSLLGRKPPKTPVKGIVVRLKNLFTYSWRGLIGVLVPLGYLPTRYMKEVPHRTVEIMWIWMAWFFLFQPVNVPVTALIPVFVLPFSGVFSSVKTCGCYMNEGILLFVLGSTLGLLLNNAGVDRRVMLWFLSAGGVNQFTGPRLVYKCSVAAFFLSMFCNRLIVTSVLMSYVLPALEKLPGPKGTAKIPNPKEMKYIICQAIQTSSAIGSIVIIHSSYATLAFRCIFDADESTPDIFNYSMYTMFAFPVALIMWVLNLVYHIVLFNTLGGQLTPITSLAIRTSIVSQKKSIPAKITLHEILAIVFTVLSLLFLFGRWSKYFPGWASFINDPDSTSNNPSVRDATGAAIFVILLFSLPKGYGFIDKFTKKKKSQMVLKPESSILWWRFVDLNLNYGYIYLLGSGVALNTVVQTTGLDLVLSLRFGKSLFTGFSWALSIVNVCFVSVVMANVMSGTAACVVLLPVILNMASVSDAGLPETNRLVLRGGPMEGAWATDKYLGALAVGIGTNLGFCLPFLYTPAYFCKFSGKVPLKAMVKYGLGSAVIGLAVLIVSILVYAPMVFDPDGSGVGGGVTSTTTTTEAGEPPKPDLFF